MSGLGEKVVAPVLLTTGMVVGIKTIERVSSYKRRKKGGKRKAVKVKSYKRKVKRKQKKKRR